MPNHDEDRKAALLGQFVGYMPDDIAKRFQQQVVHDGEPIKQAMSKSRANEIYDAAVDAGKGRCYYDPCCHLREHMLPSEIAAVDTKWKEMRGSSCWWDAFNSFRR